MKLKTLKDIEGIWSNGRNEIGPLHVNVDELKQEVIRWYHRSDGNKHRFIMEFFNITEEDLK